MGQTIEIIPAGEQRNGLLVRADRIGAWVVETAEGGGFEPSLSVTFRGPGARARAMQFFRNAVLALDENDRR